MPSLEEPYTLLEHAHEVARLLNEPWDASGAVRSWHTMYRLDGKLVHASIVQHRGMPGFQVGWVTRGEYGQEQSGSSMSTIAACIWLGLDEVGTPLAWGYEL